MPALKRIMIKVELSRSAEALLPRMNAGTSTKKLRFSSSEMAFPQPVKPIEFYTVTARLKSYSDTKP